MFLPENIDLSHPGKYDLSVRLLPNGFSFYIRHPEDPSVFHFQETDFGGSRTYADHIKKTLFDAGFFSQEFRRTVVTVVSPHFTLIPDVFFDPGRARSVSDFNFYRAEGTLLQDDHLYEGYRVLYTVQEEVYAFLSRNLWYPVFHHHTYPLLRLFKTYRQDEPGKRFFTVFGKEYLTVVGFSEKQLLFANMFSSANPHDTTYFIANIWEKSSFDQRSDHLFLSGDLSGQTAVIDILRQLILHVEEIILTPKTTLTDKQRESLPTDIVAELCE